MDIYQVDRFSVHTVFAVRGELDIATVDRFVETLQAHLNGCQALGIGLDLSGVTFMDCTGVQALIVVGRYAADLGLTICLAAVSPRVARLLDLLELPPGSCYLAEPAGAALTLGTV